MLADRLSKPRPRSGDDALLGVHSQIAEQLRIFYDAIQDEAIPQKFLTLLEQLDKAEQSGAEAAGTGRLPAAAKQRQSKAGGRHG